MGVLQDVLNYKQQKEAQQAADLQAIPQAALLFQQAQQNRAKLQLEQLSTMADVNLKQHQAKYYGNIVDAVKGGGGIGGGVLGGLDQTAMNPDDYLVKPELRSLRGIPTLVNTPELKPPVPQKDFQDFKGLETIGLELEQNLAQLTENKDSFKKYMTPTDIRSHRGDSVTGWAGNMLMKLAKDPDTNEFAAFKAETDKAFQKFRKETTGAQAALKELGWIAPDLPEASDPPELYAKKANVALQKMAEAKTLLLDLYSQRGYRVGDLRKGVQQREALKAVNATKSGNTFKRIS